MLISKFRTAKCWSCSVLRVAGLEKPDAGSIKIDGEEILGIHPRDRDVAMVFQNYALYPLMSVRENLSFGMRINKKPRAEIKTRINRVADVLGIAELMDRRPAQLSGGQRQRVAMGRDGSGSALVPVRLAVVEP